MPLTLQQAVEQSKLLNTLLTELQAGKHEVLEYGVAGEPGGYYSAMRIRWMPIAGGTQFGLKLLNSFGQEGSGYYTPDQHEIAIAAQRQLDHFHRETPFKARLEQMKADYTVPEFTWFATVEPQSDRSPIPGFWSQTSTAPEA